ncbi:hypothetical protein DFS33DRAFT_1318393 [Desarmillaria ectypa]|nr:hypothetical protein DFS33DRAFT_1318393 [Desarmillaria ectypa]
MYMPKAGVLSGDRQLSDIPSRIFSITFLELQCSLSTCLVFRAENDVSLKVVFCTQPTSRAVASFPGFSVQRFNVHRCHLPVVGMSSHPILNTLAPVVEGAVSLKIKSCLTVNSVLHYIPSRLLPIMARKGRRLNLLRITVLFNSAGKKVTHPIHLHRRYLGQLHFSRTCARRCRHIDSKPSFHQHEGTLQTTVIFMGQIATALCACLPFAGSC